MAVLLISLGHTVSFFMPFFAKFGGGKNNVFWIYKWEEQFQACLSRCFLSPVMANGDWMFTESQCISLFPGVSTSVTAEVFRGLAGSPSLVPATV